MANAFDNQSRSPTARMNQRKLFDKQDIEADIRPFWHPTFEFFHDWFVYSIVHHEAVPKCHHSYWLSIVLSWESFDSWWIKSSDHIRCPYPSLLVSLSRWHLCLLLNTSFTRYPAFPVLSSNGIPSLLPLPFSPSSTNFSMAKSSRAF